MLVRAPMCLVTFTNLYFFVVCPLLLFTPVSPEINGHERRAKELDGAPVFHLKRRESNSYEDELDEETATSFSRSQSSTWHWEGINERKMHMTENNGFDEL